ncbi:nucleotidyltransferase family protein [Novosphingobium sp.]|uniref:nucleotidyltransferase family protein n=1 Tax=Novosphingobium sp. TaxID=1874826 RepID=UPI003BAC5CC4
MRDVHHLQISAILRGDSIRWHLLGLVADLGLPDCWIAAGFVRNAVWDALHNRPPRPPLGDVDVIWFDPDRSQEWHDRSLEDALCVAAPSIDWSVKNQARMHTRNNDPPYQSATDAMRYWPETATAVAARRSGRDQIEIASPLGLDDLLNLVLRPTQRFITEKLAIYDERISSKDWTTEWPLLACTKPLAT